MSLLRTSVFDSLETTLGFRTHNLLVRANSRHGIDILAWLNTIIYCSSRSYGGKGAENGDYHYFQGII